MPLTPGTRLGPYEILSPIGAGGMGEVYRARDTKLDRDVAVKVLPEEFAADPERLARFEREAKLLASLNHPNIAHIHGFEESESLALILELVEGPTLAERIEQGPIPMEEAIAIAKQIAEALEAGHEAGVIHRDLKPANIKLKEDGTVKVLDYGLAKALEGDPSSGADSDSSQSPTLTRQGTQVGIILGTAAYMSPEQAKGKRVDKRTDIWAFGVVLYEMLTGDKAFPGDGVSDVLAAVIKTEPDWEKLAKDTDPAVVRVLRRCLQKDVARRMRDVGDARIELEESGSHESEDVLPTVAPAFWQQSKWLLVLASVLIALAWFAGRQGSKASSRDETVTRYVVTLPDTDLLIMSKGGLAVAPDGQKLAYVGSRDGVRQLYLRERNRVDAVPLPGTEGAETPFFSPDGQWLAFLKGRSLMKVSLTGGAPLLISEVKTPDGANFSSRGGSWSSLDTIFLGSQFGALSVPATGGDARPLPSQGLRFPFALPDGESVLMDDDGRVIVHNLVSGEDRVLLDGRQPRVVSDYLVVVRERSLWAAPFDVERAQVTGPALPVVDGVSPNKDGTSYDVSVDGALAFVPSAPQGSLSVVDPSGGSTELMPIDDYHSIRLSPDGRRIVGDTNTPAETWVYTIASGTRLTVASGGVPAWSPDGASVVYAGGAPGEGEGVAIKAADGTGDERVLLRGSEFYPSSWSSDGAWIAVSRNDRELASSFDIWIASPSGEATPFLATPANEYGARFSPNGRWIAYQSDQTGRYEVYVVPFRGSGERVAVSVRGGTSPIWSHDGSKLYYRQDTAVMVASVEDEDSLSFTPPRQVVDGPYWLDSTHHVSFGVFPDGKLLLIDTGQKNEIHVVLNWLEELKSLVPKE